MNDFEKHLQKNRHGVQGELKIELSDGRVIITFMKNLVEDSDTIPIGLDVPVAIGNDPGKDGFIDDQISSEEFDLPEDINPEKSSFDVDQTFPKKVGCARCQNTFENFNDLTKHFSTAHGFNPSLKPEIFKRGMTKADLVEDLDTIPIGLDVPVAIGNDPGKEDFIDEQNSVQDLLQQPIPSQDLSTKTMVMSSKKCGKRKDLTVTTAAKEAKINTQVASKQPKINKKGATWVRGIEKTR
jgi:uncharacterized C2H2 Zn-finger protein